MGHQAGDQMLKTISDIFQEYFDSQDIFRIGGDEFVILCKNVGRGGPGAQDRAGPQADGGGWLFLSTGLEWRESALDIEDVIQKAERAMQENKRGFYSSKGGERQKRELNQYMERLISEKKDADRFLSILAPVFEGVFFVNLETDTVRQIFIPSYFQEMLEECGDKYSRALLLYADRMVEPQYASLFELCCDYSRLEAMLEGDEIPDFTYRKKDGSRLRLRILKFYHYDSAGKETLWIFSDIEINYIEL
ncbi:MAG: diguanylate cyclase domain-containing protein [Enterocloster clostridioformis]